MRIIRTRTTSTHKSGTVWRYSQSSGAVNGGEQSAWSCGHFTHRKLALVSWCRHFTFGKPDIGLCCTLFFFFGKYRPCREPNEGHPVSSQSLYWQTCPSSHSLSHKSLLSDRLLRLFSPTKFQMLLNKFFKLHCLLGGGRDLTERYRRGGSNGWEN